ARMGVAPSAPVGRFTPPSAAITMGWCCATPTASEAAAMSQPRACRGHRAAAPMSRRELLRAGGLGLFGLGLPQLLHARQVARARPGGPGACILRFMWGGPAQQDTWDPKPEAPAEFRGEFRPIATRVPGVQVCEHLPLLAQHADKLALLRAMTHPDV